MSFHCCSEILNEAFITETSYHNGQLQWNTRVPQSKNIVKPVEHFYNKQKI